MGKSNSGHADAGNWGLRRWSPLVRTNCRRGWHRLRWVIGGWRSHPVRLMIGSAIAVLLLCLWFTPGAAAPSPRGVTTKLAIPETMVMLDGKPLFTVKDSGQYSASERASLINLQLQAAVAGNEPLTVRIEQRNQLPTVLLNSRYLLTVTDQDVSGGRTPTQQATEWASTIQDAVNQAQAERNPDHLRKMALQAVAIILTGLLVHRLLNVLHQRVLRSLQHLTAQPEDETTPPTTHTLDQFLTLLLGIIRTTLWVMAVLYIANLFPLTRSWSYQIAAILLSSVTSPILPLGKTAYSVLELLLLGGLFMGWVVIGDCYDG